MVLAYVLRKERIGSDLTSVQRPLGLGISVPILGANHRIISNNDDTSTQVAAPRHRENCCSGSVWFGQS